MGDDIQFICNYEGHDQEEILGFCLNNDCKENIQYCIKCSWDKHRSHENDCQAFKQIQAKNLIDQQNKQNTIIVPQNYKAEEYGFWDILDFRERFEEQIIQEMPRSHSSFQKILSLFTIKFIMFCIYILLLEILLEQLDQGLQTLNLFTLGISGILEYINKLENQKTLMKQEIDNPKQPIQNQNIKEQQNKIQIVKEPIQKQINQQTSKNQLSSKTQSQIKILEQTLQQEIDKNTKNSNQPASKVQLTLEQVNYYQSQLEVVQLKKQCIELLEKEKYKETLDLINKANLNKTEDNFEMLQIKWKCLFKLNQSKEALEICNQIIEQNPKKSQILPLKGLTLHQLNRFQEAIDFFNKAIQINPNEFNGFFHKGQTLLVLKRYEEAVKCFERSIEIDPESEHAYFLLGNALQKLEKFYQAVENYNITININPKHQMALTFKAQCLIEQQIYEEAIRAADAAILINGSNSLALYTKGFGLLKVKAFKEALDCFDKVIIIDNQMHQAHALKGETFHQMSKFIAAVTSYDLALQIFLDPQYLLKKAESLIAMEKVEEAKTLKNQAQQLIDQQKRSNNLNTNG